MALPGRSPLPLRASDLLLIVLIGVGAAYLLGPVLVRTFARGFAPAPADVDQATVALILVLLAAQTGILLAAIYGVAVRWRGLSWAELGLVPPPAAWYGRAAVITVASFAVVAVINAAVHAVTGAPPYNPQLRIIAPAGFSWSALAGMVALAGVVAPFVEELAFRGLLYRWLRERFGLWVGVGASALAFSLVHGIPALIPALAALGAILALVYERSGSLWPAIVVHGAYNTVVTVGLYVALALGYDLP